MASVPSQNRTPCHRARGAVAIFEKSPPCKSRASLARRHSGGRSRTRARAIQARRNRSTTSRDALLVGDAVAPTVVTAPSWPQHRRENSSGAVRLVRRKKSRCCGPAATPRSRRPSARWKYPMSRTRWMFTASNVGGVLINPTARASVSAGLNQRCPSVLRTRRCLPRCRTKHSRSSSQTFQRAGDHVDEPSPWCEYAPSLRQRSTAKQHRLQLVAPVESSSMRNADCMFETRRSAGRTSRSRFFGA